MMIRHGYARKRRIIIPHVSSGKSEPQNNDFRKGLITYPPNDIRPKDSLSYITDARVGQIGNYKTRQGCDFYSVPIGEAVNVQQTSTSGAADKSFSTTTWYSMKVVATATGPLTKVDARLKNDASATGVVIVEVWSNNSGNPGTLLARSSISNPSISGSYAYISARFITCPTITNGSTYHVVIYTQGSGTGSYKISSTTNTTTALISTDGGSSWSTTSYSLNVKLYTSTVGGVKGVYRAYRPNGAATTFFAHGSTLYSINDVDGVTTSVDTGINASSTYVRLEFVNDTLYYTDGYTIRKWDFAAAAAVSGAPSTAKSLIQHVGIMFYMDAADPTKVFFTNFALYDTFTSTDFLYVDAPKKADYLTAFAKLNGALYIYSRTNKYVLYGTDNHTFRLDEANAQKGTFTQESVVWDENFIYAATDEGVFQFNGTYEKNLTFNEGKGIQDKWDAIVDKDNCILELHGNRLYVWYTLPGEADNSHCLVYNTTLGIWESDDTGTYIGRAFARHDKANLFIQASNRSGTLYYGELTTNDYTNLGDILEFEVRTNYDPFGVAKQLKRIPKWRPDFQSTQGAYSAQAGYAADYSDDFIFSDIPLQGTGYTYDSADALYDSATYAGSGQVDVTTLEVFGEAYRWQRVYKHHAAREPVEFTGEVLQIQAQRMR